MESFNRQWSILLVRKEKRARIVVSFCCALKGALFANVGIQDVSPANNKDGVVDDE